MSESTVSDVDVVLDVRDLAKQYPGAAAHALDGVSLQLRRGEVLGLLGPNGAGKTTLIETITGFRRADSGRIRVLGLDPSDRAQLQRLRRRVGLVSQQVGHLRYLSVRETLELHHALHARPRSVDEVLDLVDLVDAADQRVRRLSGGQQRRLDVAVALVGRPELVLLDEPTTGFDPGARRRAWDVIERLASEGTSVLLTTHYMEEATRLADRVVVLGAGRIRGEGTPDTLARELHLGTVIRARVPDELTADELPPTVRVGLVEPGRFELHADEPTEALAQLCSWAVDRGMSLEELDVRAPTLEESYLALTGEVVS
ncbi:MAG: ABC transporter ATP-binding protein [Thermoleophilia bacterium]|nr:ABC transporter ATP-binding protein [Thermoleophilia bacterium]